VGIKWADRLAKRIKHSPYTYFSCYPDDEGFVLAVDFSDVALTATTQVADFYDSDEYDHMLHVLHSTELGARELFKSDGWRERLADALRSVTALLNQGIAKDDQINMLVLLGDLARDARLQIVLQDLLGDQYDRLITSAKDNNSGTGSAIPRAC
jgi:hypothetical protein